LLGTVLLLPGCDTGPQLGQVEGTVLLGGTPLPDAVVIFQPTSGGPSSHGLTDKSGHYELMFAADEPGALVGKHMVTVETKRFHIPDSVEKVPAKYNAQTELEREVVAEAQTINLELDL
jgi:hypothetical protein